MGAPSDPARNSPDRDSKRAYQFSLVDDDCAIETTPRMQVSRAGGALGPAGGGAPVGHAQEHARRRRRLTPATYSSVTIGPGPTPARSRSPSRNLSTGGTLLIVKEIDVGKGGFRLDRSTEGTSRADAHLRDRRRPRTVGSIAARRPAGRADERGHLGKRPPCRGGPAEARLVRHPFHTGVQICPCGVRGLSSGRDSSQMVCAVDPLG